jgi:hypothetical protein
MKSWHQYSAIKAHAIVTIINLQDDHCGDGVDLKEQCYKYYNRFKLLKIDDSMKHDDICNQIDDYINNLSVYNEGDVLILSNIRNHQFAVPYSIYKKKQHSMFSGCYIVGDASMHDMVGHLYPIGVHNRTENNYCD